MLKPGLQSHLETCPDKADLEAIVAYGRKLLKFELLSFMLILSKT